MSGSQIYASHNLTELAASDVTPEAPKRPAKDLGTPFKGPKLDNVPRPVEIIVKLSEKSFINPIFGTEADRYDICINVFYNGEFNASQVIKYSAWAANGRKGYVNFGGRRIETCYELPWMITTKFDDPHSSLSLIERRPIALTPVKRWNKLTEMLLMEANEWGRDGLGYRCPTGEYLELLSGKAMPSELDSPSVSTGSGFGVIDVVITLGRMSHFDAARDISSPLRYLPSSQGQKIDIPFSEQIRSEIATPTQAAVIGSSRGYPPGLSNLNSCALELDPKNAPRSLSTNEISHVVAASSHQWDHISSSSFEVATLNADGILHSATSQAVVQRATSRSARIPAALTIAPTPRPPHPHRPKNIPQKRYRGSEPILPPSLTPKRQKTANIFEELPFDLNSAAYMSTRSRRSASTPFTRIPPKPQPESVIKRKRSVNQVKSALYIAESLETPMAGMPLTPKNDKIDNPKAPPFGGPLKKKPRSSNYNPKLSNRPQNLRRKNSAGEWIIPPCRKNSSGEWETLTEGSQGKAASVLGRHANEANPEENEKMIQPVFTISAGNTDRNIAVGPSISDGTSLSKDMIALKENIHPRHVSEQATKTSIPATVTEIKKENINPGKTEGRASEIANTAIATKLSGSLPNVSFRETGNTQKNEPIETSPTKAGAAAFDTYFRELKKVGIFISNKNKPQKKTLRIRFFEGNIGPDGEIAGDGYGRRRLLVRRCITPEYTPASDSGRKPTSYPLCEEQKSFSAFTADPQEKVKIEVTNSVLKVPSKSCRKSSTGHDSESGIANNSAIATLGASRMGASQNHQKSDTSRPRPRFVVPNHNSRVLKLVRRQEAVTETDVIKYKAQGTFGAAVVSNPVERTVAADTNNYVDGKDKGDSSAFATNGESPKILQEHTGRNGASAAQSVNVVFTESVAGPGPACTNAKDPLPDSNLEVQTVYEHLTSTQTPAGKTVLKRSFRPRTVGSTELKALLESHDRHNVVNTSLGTPLGIMNSQLMSMVSRKAISFKPRKVISSSEVVTDTKMLPDKPTVQIPFTSNSVPRKRSSSGQFIGKTAIAAIVQNLTEDTNGDFSKIADAQISAKTIPSESSYELKKALLRDQESEAPKPSTIAGMGYNVSLLGAGEILLTDTPPGQMIEKAVINLRGVSIDKTTLQHQKSKEEDLQSDVGNAVKFEAAVEEINVALQHVYKANIESSKVGGGLENLVTHSSGLKPHQNVARAGTTNAKIAEASVTEIQRYQEQGMPSPSEVARGTEFWKPGCLCDDSILKYANGEHSDGLKRDHVNIQMCRRVRPQEEGYFKAFSVLMGVRFVVVGSAVMGDL